MCRVAPFPPAASIAMEVGGGQCATERGTIEAAGGSSTLYPNADLPWQWRATMMQEGTMKRQSRCSDLIQRSRRLHRTVVTAAPSGAAAWTTEQQRPRTGWFGGAIDFSTQLRVKTKAQVYVNRKCFHSYQHLSSSVVEMSGRWNHGVLVSYLPWRVVANSWRCSLFLLYSAHMGHGCPGWRVKLHCP